MQHAKPISKIVQKCVEVPHQTCVNVPVPKPISKIVQKCVDIPHETCVDVPVQHAKPITKNVCGYNFLDGHAEMEDWMMF